MCIYIPARCVCVCVCVCAQRTTYRRVERGAPIAQLMSGLCTGDLLASQAHKRVCVCVCVHLNVQSREGRAQQKSDAIPLSNLTLARARAREHQREFRGMGRRCEYCRRCAIILGGGVLTYTCCNY